MPGAALLNATSFALRVDYRPGGSGGLRVAATRRARLASPGPALLSIILFASRFSCRFSGCGGLIAAPLRRPKWPYRRHSRGPGAHRPPRLDVRATEIQAIY